MRNVKVELKEAIKHLQAARFEVLKLKAEDGLTISERFRNLELKIHEEIHELDGNNGLIINLPSAGRAQ
jgi:hypothetical protein